MAAHPSTPTRAADDASARQPIAAQLEEVRRSASRQEARLHKAILRLAVAHSGVEPEFDRRLADLRSLLRRGADDASRRQAIEQVLDSLTEVASRHPRTESGPAAGPVLADLLGRLTLPDAHVFELRQLRARLDGAAPADLPALLGRIADTLNHACTARPAATPPAPAPGPAAPVATPAAEPLVAPPDAFTELLERLRLKGDAGLRLLELRRRALAAQAQDERLRLVEDVVALLGEALDARTVQGRLDTGAVTLVEIGNVLQQLLDWMSLPRTVAERAETIRARLDEPADEDQLTAVLKDIGHLVTDVRTSLERELEAADSLLHNLASRIAAIDAELAAAAGDRSAADADAAQLRETVDAEFQQLRHGSATAESLEALRSWTDARLESIGRSLGAFCERLSTRNAGADARNAALAARLRELEAHSAKMQARLEEERRRALTDALTGVPNRRALDRRLAADHARWRRHGGELALAVVDLDRFKSVNDTYGHRTGDKVLTSVADLLQTRLRAGDFLARFGGEEFVVILPATSLAGARDVAESLRREVEQCRFHFKGTPVPVTLSIGVAAFGGADTVESAIERADRAVYAAKHGGRNRVVTQDELPA